MDIAKSVAARSTCLRRHYGAVIVKDGAIVSTGYNGAPRGAENCCDRGTCKREELHVPHGERYELCESIHAENNAIINAARSGVSVLGGTLYIYGYDCIEHKTITALPCKMCQRVIQNAGLARILVSKDENFAKEDESIGNTRSDLRGCSCEHCDACEEGLEGKEAGREGCLTQQDEVPRARG